MNILAIDPGTKCGYALKRSQKRSRIKFGTWKLDNKSLGSRVNDVRENLAALDWELKDDDTGYLQLVVYEDVKGHKGSRAAHCYGAIVGAIEAECEYLGIEFKSVGVKTIKKHATGNGNASKDMMVAAAKKRGWKVKTDDEADALWILDYALENFNDR